MKNPFSLAGKTALVTGSTRGLGFAMARALAESGARVAINSRKADDVDATVATFRAEGLEVVPMPFDVSDAAAGKAALEKLDADHGLDILVNNAGVQHREALLDWKDEDFERVVAINLTACFRLSRDAARLMVPRKWGRIINTGSLMSVLGRQTIHGYVAAKSGLAGLTRSLAAELGPEGITINAIGPGYFATELNTSLWQDKEFTAWVESRTPVGRWGEPEELGGAVVFLASEASNYVSGHLLMVDGGMSAVV